MENRAIIQNEAILTHLITQPVNQEKMTEKMQWSTENTQTLQLAHLISK